MSRDVDVVVIGGGNAALCAAIAAAKEGARTVVLERSPERERGGNSAYTAGAMRTRYDGIHDVRRLVPNLTEGDIDTSDFGHYDAQQFEADLERVTGGRCDPYLQRRLVADSLPALLWLREIGVPFEPLYQRQSYRVDGRRRFWGGLTFGTQGGGTGLVARLYDIATSLGVETRYEARATGLTARGSRCESVVFDHRGQSDELRANAVILACGGFEANTEMRTRYLGAGWDVAKVRGSRFNTGDGIRMALDIGAMSWGQYSGAHAVFWDRDAPEFGNLAIGNENSRLSYPLGIMINARGERFLDEGADIRNYTYAKYGRELISQPGQHAWQIFDGAVEPLLQSDYRVPTATHVTSSSLEGLVDAMSDIDARAALQTIRRFNAAVDSSTPFDPTRRDGRATHDLLPPKSNWANPIAQPPYIAYAVTVGITFTFGGLRITPDEARVVQEDGTPFENLFAAGELVGGLFYDNYPGGAGLTAGTVFGRIAGQAAASAPGSSS